MNKEVIDLIIESNPDIKAVREKLEAMQPGAFCLHRAWGFGRIRDYDAAQGKLIIDFDEKQGHPMDPVFCIDKLEILPDSNILVRRRTEPEAIDEMIKKKPAELIIEILKSLPEQTASAAEIESILSRLLGPTKFRKWWTAAKKALIKDPRVAAPARKGEPYILRDEPVEPEQEILEEFYMIKQPKKKILLAEKLFQLSDNVKEIEEDLPEILSSLTEAVRQAGRQLSQAERIHGVWVRNDLCRHLHDDVEVLEPTSSSIILETEDLSKLAAEIPSAYQKRFLDLITRVYPDKWQQVVISLLRNSSGKFTSECISFLHERESIELVAENFQRWLNEQNFKGPVLYWIVKNRHSRKFNSVVKGLTGNRLLAAIFSAIDNEALQMSGSRRIPLADVLSDDQDLIADLLHDANDETARDLAQSLLLNQGFEDLTKKSLLARFIKVFPSIQSLVAGEVQQEAEVVFVSQESLDTLKGEYETIVNVKLPENKKAIEIAREHGDLRENAEYKMARQDNETLMARKAQIETQLNIARVTDFQDAPADTVGIGSIVKIKQPQGDDTIIYSILGAWDSFPERNILSYKTPLGQALLTHKVGETVATEIDGIRQEWQILEISRWADSNQKL